MKRHGIYLALRGGVFVAVFLTAILGFVYIDVAVTDGCPDRARIAQWPEWQQTLFEDAFWPLALVSACGIAWRLAVRIRVRA